MRLNMINARTARPKDDSSAYRTGVLCLTAADYPVSWGVSKNPGPHMRMNEPDPRAVAAGCPYYGCELSLFVETYVDVPGKPGTYRKAVPVSFVVLTEDTIIDTKEGPHNANAGDYVIQNPKGEQYPQVESVFNATYDIVD